MEEMMAYVRAAIGTASKIRGRARADHEPVTISIHVSTDVWEWLRSRSQYPAAAKYGTALFGFPVIEETAWGDVTRIEVQTRRVIV
jgi:hypothetical protein